MKRRLIEILLERSVRFGDFTLSSGRKSDFYVDVRETALHPEGFYLIGELMNEALDERVEAVGGPIAGAIPVVCACMAAGVSKSRDRSIPSFMVRKEPKSHGTSHWLEGAGNLHIGMAVAVLEDVTTTGSSALKAVNRCLSHGLRVVQVLTVVDRQEGATEEFQTYGIKFTPLVTRIELAGVAKG